MSLTNKRKLQDSNNVQSTSKKTSNTQKHVTFTSDIVMPSNKEAKIIPHISVEIPLDEEIDDSKLIPIDNLVQKVSVEMKQVTIENLIDRFKPILNEFMSFVEATRITENSEYVSILRALVSKLCSIYKIKVESMLVQPSKYLVPEWGRLYWNFFHYTSILLEYSYENNWIDDFRNFPTLVYNINLILPCPKCISHYQVIKESNRVKNIITSIAFGSVISGVQQFHNLITSNVDSTAEYVTRENRKLFTLPDFALKYSCIELQDELLKKSVSYIRNHVDWQTPTHTMLTTMLIMYCPQPYGRASNLIKRVLYGENSNFNGIDLKLRYLDIAPIDMEDIQFNRLTIKQLKYCLMRSILAQFQNTPITADQLKDQYTYNKMQRLLYIENVNEIYQLINLNMPLNSNGEDASNNNNNTTGVDSLPFPPTKDLLLKTLDKLEKLYNQPICKKN